MDRPEFELAGNKMNARILLGPLLLLCATFAEQPLSGRSDQRVCTVPEDEIEVLRSYLTATRSAREIIVIVTTTGSTAPDVDYLNLRLAVVGQGISPEARMDFKKKAGIPCHIRPFATPLKLYFISQSEHDQIFRTGWNEFHKRYGKGATLMQLSRVGFTSQKNLALFHISSGIDGMAASGYLYVFERRHGQWVQKSAVLDWET